MHDSITMADVGSIVNVSGNRIATPFGPPNPGSTPTKMPSRSPTSISASVFQVIRTAKPCTRSVSASMERLVAEECLDWPLGHQYVERDFEREEHGKRKQKAREHRLSQRDSPDDHHESGDQKEARHIEPKP